MKIAGEHDVGRCAHHEISQELEYSGRGHKHYGTVVQKRVFAMRALTLFPLGRGVVVRREADVGFVDDSIYLRFYQGSES